MIVADATVVASLFVNSEVSELAEAALRRDPVWAAPVLWRSEFRHTLARYVVAEQMTFEAALLAMINAESALAGREFAVSSTRVLDLAAQSRCPARDCEYVALAEDLDVRLVTTDDGIVKAFPQRALSLEAFAKAKT